MMLPIHLQPAPVRPLRTTRNARRDDNLSKRDSLLEELPRPNSFVPNSNEEVRSMHDIHFLENGKQELLFC